MSGWTIRTRLTAAIVALTTALSLLGIWFGVGVLEGQVVDDAIDERIAQFDGLESGGFDAFGTNVFSSTEFLEFFDLPGVIFGSEFQEIETAFVANAIRELEVYDDLAAEYGTPSGEVHVWLSPNTTVAIMADGTAATSTPNPATPVIPLVDLLELNSVDIDSILNGGESAELSLAFGTETLGGTTFGFVAEVTDELAAVESIRSTLQLVLAAIVVLSGVTTWLITGRALQPVGQITSRVGDITAGSLSDRVPESGRSDEIGVLARTMNTMLGRLENSDLRRRQFVSDASHELRTPVAVLRSEAEVARRAPESTTIEDFADVVLAESGRLEHLVGDLLSLARSDEHRELLPPSSVVDLDEIVLEEAARTRRLHVDKSAVSAGRVRGRADNVTRLVAHLLDNAARHGRSSVAVGVQTTGSVVRLWVDDDGPGVSERERQRIFERFIRLDDARTRDTGGAGLGLAVVAATVREMQGTIEVAEAPLGGARFLIDLPAELAARDGYSEPSASSLMSGLSSPCSGSAASTTVDDGLGVPPMWVSGPSSIA